MSYVLGTYARSVKENFVSGKGSYLYNDKNEKYLDFVQGIAVNALGHNHQALVKAMKSNSEKPWHLSNLFLIQEQEKFAERICKLTGFDAVGFQNSGLRFPRFRHTPGLNIFPAENASGSKLPGARP